MIANPLLGWPGQAVPEDLGRRVGRHDHRAAVLDSRIGREVLQQSATGDQNRIGSDGRTAQVAFAVQQRQAARYQMSFQPTAGDRAHCRAQRAGKEPREKIAGKQPTLHRQRVNPQHLTACPRARFT